MSEINLDVTTVECLPNEDGELLEEILIQSGHALTITSDQFYVR